MLAYIISTYSTDNVTSDGAIVHYFEKLFYIVYPDNNINPMSVFNDSPIIKDKKNYDYVKHELSKKIDNLTDDDIFPYSEWIRLLFYKITGFYYYENISLYDELLITGIEKDYREKLEMIKLDLPDITLVYYNNTMPTRTIRGDIIYTSADIVVKNFLYKVFYSANFL
jgi:hypothetical protein